MYKNFAFIQPTIELLYLLEKDVDLKGHFDTIDLLIFNPIVILPSPMVNFSSAASENKVF